MRINPRMKPKETTYQVVLDALDLTTCYPAFLITAEVLVIYMHQFWATVNKYKPSYRFKIDDKKFSVNVEVFRDILNICPRIKYIIDVIVDHLHQPWRTFASIINKCLYEKESPSKKKHTKAKKDAPSKKKPSSKPKLTKKKAPVKTDRGKGVPGVPKYDFESDKESWGDSGEEDKDDAKDDEGNDDGDDSDGNDDDDDNDGDDDDDNDEDDEENEEELDDGKELYKDVNVNLRQEDVEMTDADQGREDQHNKTEGPMQSSSVSSNFTKTLLNFKNVSLADNEIASVIDTIVRTEEPRESLEDVVLTKSSSQPKSTYEASASLSEYELMKILLDKMEESKSHLRADCKRKLYNALVESYNTDKDLFNTYETRTTLTPDPDWNKKQQVEFRPPQTWISVTARVEKPPTSFDELMDTPIDFSAFVMNRLNIPNLTQELLVGLAFNLLKGICKSLMELEYHFEESTKATTERLDWHNPEGKPYPFDLCNPLLLILDYRGHQVIPQDYFINNDLEYLKGGSLSRQYSTSVTKTKAATYEIKWIEDMVPNL
nr:hypothetical protein [Tanacetum cinerariifolium]